MNRVLEVAKQGVTRVGAACSPSTLLRLNSVLNYLWVGHWMKSRGFRVLQRVDSREEVFGIAAEEIRDREVLYLEFGVYRGRSMRIWSSLLRNPKATCTASIASTVYLNRGISVLRRPTLRWKVQFL